MNNVVHTSKSRIIRQYKLVCQLVETHRSQQLLEINSFPTSKKENRIILRLHLLQWKRTNNKSSLEEPRGERPTRAHRKNLLCPIIKIIFRVYDSILRPDAHRLLLCAAFVYLVILYMYTDAYCAHFSRACDEWRCAAMFLYMMRKEMLLDWNARTITEQLLLLGSRLYVEYGFSDSIVISLTFLASSCVFFSSLRPCRLRNARCIAEEMRFDTRVLHKPPLFSLSLMVG